MKFDFISALIGVVTVAILNWIVQALGYLVKKGIDIDYFPEISALRLVEAYAIGLHKGMYEALVQVKPVTVIRDYDRDAILDFYNGIRQTGIFGINIHRAESSGATKLINKYSAGCQVFQNAEDFKEFMALARQHQRLYGNKFSYTLIDFRAMRRVAWRRVITASTITACLAIGWVLTYND